MAKTKMSAEEKANDPRRILTPEFRVSYPHLFKPNAMKGSTPKYSITMLFKKTADLSVMKLAMKHAKIDEFGSKENWPDDLASPVVDGDLPKYADKEGYKGHWAIKATSNEASKPGLVDLDVEPILEQSEFYPGCYARAQVFARVWEFPEGSGRYGIQFILDHVQKTKEGKAFGGKKSAKEVFDPISGGDDGESDDAESDDNDDDGDFT